MLPEAGMTDACYPNSFLLVEMGFTNFLPWLAWNGYPHALHFLSS
jgi:hypothetical protein